MKPVDFDQSQDGLNSNHREDSFALLKIDLNGQPDMGDAGRTDLMSIRLTYAESPEDLHNEQFKQIKFWLYKEDAEKYGEAIHRTATARKRLDPDTNKNLPN